MNIQLRRKATQNVRPLNIAAILRQAAWLGLVVISFLYSVTGSSDALLYWSSPIARWIYIYLPFGTFVLALLVGAVILFRKPDSWLAFTTAVMLVTFTATDWGFVFWYRLFTGEPAYDPAGNYSLPETIALFLTVFYMVILTTSLAFVLMTFPDGKMPSRAARRFFILLVASEILLIILMALLSMMEIFFDMGNALIYSGYFLLDLAKNLLLVFPLGWQLHRLRKITDPVQRQQIKWVAFSLVGMTFFTIAAGILNFWSAIQYGEFSSPAIYLPGLIFTYGFIIALFFAVVRYRLWDIGFIINQTLVYTSVSTLLTVFGIAGAELLEYLARDYLPPGSSLVGGFVLMAALFTPVRDRMQALVDRHLKPEEVDFSTAIVELAPGAGLVLSAAEMMRILARQMVEQLNVSGAAIFLRDPNGQLTLHESDAPEPIASPLTPDEKTLSRLEKGDVVVPPEGSSFSLLVPLVVKRASRPDFQGVLVFGSRNSGEGYATPLLKSLKALGQHAGKAIYLARLRDQLGQNVVERLSTIDRKLSSLEIVNGRAPRPHTSRAQSKKVRRTVSPATKRRCT
jgi:hypothetical protein